MFAVPVNHGCPELQGGFAAAGTGTLPVWGPGAKRPGRRKATCGRNDQLTNRIEDSDGEPARSVARMRIKTAPRKGRAPPSLQH